MKQENFERSCNFMAEMLDEGSVSITFLPRFREYGIDLRESEAFQLMYFCPWCGKKLPEPLRDQCAKELEAMGHELFDDDDIPEKYKTDAWWREKTKN